MLTECGVPAEFMSAQTIDFPSYIQESVTKEKGKSMFITGGYGCGKTHLSVAILREFISGLEIKKNETGEYGFNKAYMPVFSVVTELLLDIRATFSTDNGKNEKLIVDRYGDTGFLILDDLGVEKTSDWSLQTFYTIINRRSNKHLPTVITTNLSMDEIGQKLGGRIASRVKGMCKIIHLTGRDRRLSK